MIEAHDLTKYYGPVAAVKEVSFEVKKGEILGFLGPNGAGKSTTMKMLTTFLYPTSGRAVLNGFDILNDPLKVRQCVGYLPENTPLYDDMLVKDFLYFAAGARRLKPASKAVERVLEECFIREVQNHPIYTLSKGYRQRVCFAQAIIHDPDILILDEPTNGLDPNQKIEVRRMISNMGQGKAILLSTHILDEAVAICNRCIIISQGLIKANDTLPNLMRQAPEYGKLDIVLNAEENEDSIVNSLRDVKYVKLVDATKQRDNDKIFHTCVYPEKGHDISGSVLEHIKAKNWNVTSFTMCEGRLEDVFRFYTVAQEKK